ncbi:Methyltransferase-like protein 5 [Gurleya vavrai]
MKLKHLKSELTKIKPFKNPKINFEQYLTPPDIAATFLYTAHFEYDDIENKNILDLCCGTGMLTVAASFFDPANLTCLDCDSECLEICKENFDFFEIENYEILNLNFENYNPEIRFDTVIMNPPFGTRSEGIDVKAIEKALQVGKIVYSLHKKSTRNFLLNKFKNAKLIAEVKYEIKNSYKFHKKEIKIIEVDLIRFVNDL